MPRPPRSTPPPTPDLGTLLRGGSLREPSRAVLARALALGAELPRKKSVLALVADLVFDSARSPLPAGVRSRPTERRLLYQAAAEGVEDGQRQLDLRVRREAAGTIELTGQCVPPPEKGQVEIEAGRTRRKVKLGETGEFVVRGLPGRAALMLLRVKSDGEPAFEIPDVPRPEA